MITRDCPTCGMHGGEAITHVCAPGIAAMTPAHRPLPAPAKPHKCPICGGRGTVPTDFYAQIGYSTSTTPEQCRSCGGRGVIWG